MSEPNETAEPSGASGGYGWDRGRICPVTPPLDDADKEMIVLAAAFGAIAIIAIPAFGALLQVAALMLIKWARGLG